jgi:putative nucleotidyltransferase with HDIG domain
VTSLHALMQALTRATEYRDPYTAGHQLAVAELAHDTGQRLGLTEADCRTLRLGAALHDLGKIAVPAEILTKPGRLTEAEMMMIRTHPQIGHDILADIEFAEPVRDMVLHHHERLDGSGYPDGLAGDEIAVSTRIVTTADVADAMRAHRPYRPSLGNAVAEEHLRAHSGTLYDADVVEAVIDVLRARDRAPAAAG